jgi:stage V sporulation protein SpoVS
MNNDEKNILKVKGATNSKKLASTIVACYFNGDEKIKLRGIGAGAIAQMVYAVIIAEGLLKHKNVIISYKHYYKDVPNENYSAEKKNDLTITAIEYELNFS